MSGLEYGWQDYEQTAPKLVVEQGRPQSTMRTENKAPQSDS